jgi:hypothetical protein
MVRAWALLYVGDTGGVAGAALYRIASGEVWRAQFSLSIASGEVWRAQPSTKNLT